MGESRVDKKLIAQTCAGRKSQPSQKVIANTKAVKDPPSRPLKRQRVAKAPPATPAPPAPTQGVDEDQTSDIAAPFSDEPALRSRQPVNTPSQIQDDNDASTEEDHEQLLPSAQAH